MRNEKLIVVLIPYTHYHLVLFKFNLTAFALASLTQNRLEQT